MYRIKYLFAILSAAAAFLYVVFGMLSLQNSTLSTFDIVMPFCLCALHLLVSIILLLSSYKEHQRELVRLRVALHELLRSRTSLTPEDFAIAAKIPLAEAHEFFLLSEKRRELVVLSKHENTVTRAFAPYSHN